MKLKVRRNLALFKLNSFFSYMWPLSAVAIIYFQQITGSYATAALAFSVWLLVQSLAKIPAGMISDRWSRKKTMLMAIAFFMLAGLFFALAGTFGSTPLLFVGTVFWGVTSALSMGTDEAMMFETMTDLRKKDKYDIVFSSTRIYLYIGSAFAMAVAVPIIYFSNLTVLAWVSIIPSFGRMIINLYLVEPECYKKSETSGFGHFASAVKKFWKNKKLISLALSRVMNTGWGEAQLRMNSLYINIFVPVWAVTIIMLIGRLCSSVGFYIAIFLRKVGLLKMAMISNFFRFFTILAGLLMNNIVSPFMISASYLGQGGENSGHSALLHKEFSDQERATMSSIIEIMAGLLTALAFYVFGLLADIYSVYFAMFALIAYKLVISLYVWCLMRKYGD